MRIIQASSQVYRNALVFASLPYRKPSSNGIRYGSAPQTWPQIWSLGITETTDLLWKQTRTVQLWRLLAQWMSRENLGFKMALTLSCTLRSSALAWTVSVRALLANPSDLRLDAKQLLRPGCWKLLLFAKALVLFELLDKRLQSNWQLSIWMESCRI